MARTEAATFVERAALAVVSGLGVGTVAGLIVGFITYSQYVEDSSDSWGGLITLMYGGIAALICGGVTFVGLMVFASVSRETPQVNGPAAPWQSSVAPEKQILRSSNWKMFLLAIPFWIPAGLLAGAFANPWTDRYGADVSQIVGWIALIVTPVLCALLTLALRAVTKPLSRTD